MSKENIKLTGTTLTAITLHIEQLSNYTLFDQLSKKVSQAPRFFNQSPLVIDLANLAFDEMFIDLEELLAHCRQIGLEPMAYKNVHNSIEARYLSLPILASKSNSKEINPSNSTPTLTATEAEEKPALRPGKMITRPVRSGQQVYAEGTDLIVQAQISEGAEVIADGNIHVYGALRGRALAGVKGDINACIFCQQMRAELVSIAGNFLLSDDLDASLYNQAVKISLIGDRLVTEALR